MLKNLFLVLIAAFSLTLNACDDDKESPAQDCVVRDMDVGGEEAVAGEDAPEAGEPVAGELVGGEDVPAGEEAPEAGAPVAGEVAQAGTEMPEAGMDLPEGGEEVVGGEEQPEAGMPAGSEEPSGGSESEEVIPG